MNNFLITITSSGVAESFEKHCIENNIKCIVTHARGTAKPSIWSLFGLADNKKVVFFIDSDVELNKIVNFASQIDDKKIYMAQIGGKMSKERLFVGIVNSGFADEIMDLARRLGATGGTILDGRGTGKNAEYILGQEVDSSKEIVLIFCTEELAKKLEDEMNDFIEKNDHVSGICFTLNAKLFKQLNTDNN